MLSRGSSLLFSAIRIFYDPELDSVWRLSMVIIGSGFGGPVLAII